MKKSTLKHGLVTAALIALSMTGYGLPNTTPHTYPSGVKVAVQIGNDLYDSLDDKYRNKLQEPPVCAVPATSPELVLTENTQESKVRGQLSISLGYVDLINHIAHAKAVDRVEPGFFAKYMANLANDNGNPPTAPEISEDRFWTDEVMNDQSSYFNQMMGMTMAINLSRHYLGQYDKYSSKMQDGSINNCLTSSEWDSGVRAGAVNSLNCAFSTDGAKALFDAIGKMAHRPAWASCIVPQNIDIPRLNKQLAKYEVDFFHGGLK